MTAFRRRHDLASSASPSLSRRPLATCLSHLRRWPNLWGGSTFRLAWELIEARTFRSNGGARTYSSLNASRTTLEIPVSYTHLRAHETVLDLVCRLLLE